jgi:hypothetical protein
MAEHGTRARYIKHIRDGEEACTECKAGNAANSKAYAASSPEITEKANAKKRAISRAQVRLRNLYPVEFEVLYQEELRKEELE